MKRSLLILGLVVWLVVPPSLDAGTAGRFGEAGISVVTAAQGGGQLTGKVLVRERENGEHSLLIEARGLEKIHRITFNAGRRFNFGARFLPSDWKVLAQGNRLEASGEPLYRVNLRFDAKPNENLIRSLAGKEVELQIGAGTPDATTLKVKVGTLPRVRFRDDWAALVAMTFPPERTPGAPVLASPAPEYVDGVFIPGWDKVEASLQRAEEHVKRAEALLTDRARTPPARQQRLFNWTAIFDEVKDFEQQTARQPTFTYFDAFYEAVLARTASIKAVPAAVCTPGITGGTLMAFTGKDACMQGCFGDKLSELTDLEKAAVMLLDDKPVTPQAASPTTIVVRIPNDATPGPHYLKWQGVPGQLSIRILSVQGSIDQNQLWKGQSTTMRLQILGSDQPIPLKIVNRTPTTIDVEGGVDQTIPSSGGPINVVNRQVKGIMKGDFTIDYSVDQPACGTK